MTPLEHVDIAASAFKRDPHPVFRQWRKSNPVVRVRLKGPFRPADEAYLFSRYADVSGLLKDARFVKDPVNADLPPIRVPRFIRPLTRNMLALDEPDHGRLKRLVQAAFTTRRIEALEAEIAVVSSDLIAGLRRSGGGNLVANYALPLPVAVISALLGVPQPDRAKFARWSGAFIRAATSTAGALAALPGMISFLRYLRQLIETKRRNPGDDIVSTLVATSEGGNLSEEELMAMIAILLNAGHETTTSLISNGWLLLMDDVEASQRLRDEPALIRSAVEELLRMAGPAMTTTPRYAREDVDVAGSVIPKGAVVLGLIASANRDDEQFSQPDKLDLGRTPNRHLAFGEGGHYCIGAALARAEARIAFRDLLTALPPTVLGIDPGQLRYRPGLVLRGPERLPIAFKQSTGRPDSQ